MSAHETQANRSHRQWIHHGGWYHATDTSETTGCQDLYRQWTYWLRIGRRGTVRVCRHSPVVRRVVEGTRLLMATISKNNSAVLLQSKAISADASLGIWMVLRAENLTGCARPQRRPVSTNVKD